MKDFLSLQKLSVGGIGLAEIKGILTSKINN